MIVSLAESGSKWQRHRTWCAFGCGKRARLIHKYERTVLGASEDRKYYCEECKSSFTDEDMQVMNE